MGVLGQLGRLGQPGAPGAAWPTRQRQKTPRTHWRPECDLRNVIFFFSIYEAKGGDNIRLEMEKRPYQGTKGEVWTLI